MVARLAGITLIAAALGVAWVMPATQSNSARAISVPCTDIVLQTKFPYRGLGYRAVLGSLSVPPAYARQVVPTRNQPWPYFRKAGLVVRAGAAAVTIRVPRAWRGRAAISWGNHGGPVSSLKIARCDGPKAIGHAYAGGFYLSARAACVPILFQVGDRRSTVHFGLGRRC